VSCSSGTKPGNDAGSNDSGSDAPVTNGTWAQVVPMDGASSQATTVTGFWFSSSSNGVVSFAEGLVEHFSAPTTIDAIALDGSGKLPGPADDSYYGFVPGTSLGLVVRNSSAKSLVTSSNMGTSFTYAASYGTLSGAPPTITLDFPLLWLGEDASNKWHVAVGAGGGDVYSSPTAPGPSAALTDTWHPEGVVTVPATLPTADCAAFVTNGYYSTQPGQVFAATTDASSILYSSGSSICRSSDGGKNFVDVSTHITPSTFNATSTPWTYTFTSPTVGIGVYGSEADAPGTAYVLYTTDGGDNWTVGTLPASAANMVSLIGTFAAPNGTLFIVGGGPSLVLYDSADGGKTWTDLSTKLNTWASTLDNPPLRLETGFALDAQHIWVGGDSGFIAYTATGGQ
jgi:hypothetical protein